SSGSCVGERCPSEGGPAPSRDRPPGALGGPVGPALVDAHIRSPRPGDPPPGRSHPPHPVPAPPSAGRDPRLAPAGSGSPTHTKAGRAPFENPLGKPFGKRHPTHGLDARQALK